MKLTAQATVSGAVMLAAVVAFRPALAQAPARPAPMHVHHVHLNSIIRRRPPSTIRNRLPLPRATTFNGERGQDGQRLSAVHEGRRAAAERS